ncbi:hypothetical protein GCM10009785_04960 [Brooklawnia cerclae]
MRSRLENAGIAVVLVDVSTVVTEAFDDANGYSAQDIRRPLENEWRELAGAGRGAKIDFMARATRDFVVLLQERGQIDGVISAGGLQNTTLATAAMKALPIGFPKVMATTVATGRRSFMSVVGDRDVVVVPALADMAGLNFATRSTLNTACDCLIGLMSNRTELQRPDRPVVGLTLMGVTNAGAAGAIHQLERHGFEAVGFHATGAGGGVLEEFVRTGLVDAVLDMNLHEIVNECFQGGYSFGVRNRLSAAIERGIPLVVTPGGLDFVDYMVNEFEPGLAGRKYVLHNGTLAHIKLTVDEAAMVGGVVGERLRGARVPVRLVVPTAGLRADTDPGEPMHDPPVDEALVQAIVEHAGDGVEVERVAMNLNTEEFGALVADRMIEAFDHAGARPSTRQEVGSL